MNLNHAESVGLATQLRDQIKTTEAEVVICPSFTALSAVANVLKNSELKLGAQNVSWEIKGALTGEESSATLVELGCQYVVIGHSERRQQLHETDEMSNRKVIVSLEQKLIPIICIGETLDERRRGLTDSVLWQQLSAALKNIPWQSGDHVIIAYEPVWVIGTGQAIDPNDAAAAMKVIHHGLLELMPDGEARKTRIIYGGSVDPTNVASFAQLPECHGFLVGTASLDPERFCAIIPTLNPTIS